MKVICISASNILHSGGSSVSMEICGRVDDILSSRGVNCDIIDLRQYYNMSPCIGCGRCYSTRRCAHDEAFNGLYEKLISADGAVFVSPHYAPIPARLCMLLEKLKEITFLHWWKDNGYRSEVYGKPAAIISHGGASEWALKSYKAMVNDTIANALDTIKFKTMAYDEEWGTGISLPVADVTEDGGIFPVQSYNWQAAEDRLKEYMEKFFVACGGKCRKEY
ncbi:MAG: flavodoxin family protein [Acutalibacter sp.]|jgi:multimeric flavodoxin WrbA|uniref:flavodoxin family protein n=1 Tax=Acutalibacter sp. TaxID=1918636 RepID=UPI00216EA835|nr:NAD(P)H-dependent oxidoreductase [Acutalibacter sp.]MCI9225853.1 flavodoxin family protein [Acutalibacter sp.]